MFCLYIFFSVCLYGVGSSLEHLTWCATGFEMLLGKVLILSFEEFNKYADELIGLEMNLLCSKQRNC